MPRAYNTRVITITGNPSDEAEVEALATTALSTSVTYSDAVDVYGFSSVDFSLNLTSSASPTLASVEIFPQWSTVATPASNADWTPYLREEFSIAASPTSDGQGTESVYSALIPVSGGAIPTRKAGITLKTKGLWMRVGCKGDATVSDVDFQVFSLRRS
jgi:hypothetical protein